MAPSRIRTTSLRARAAARIGEKCTCRRLEEGRGGANLGKPVEEIATHREGYQLSFYQLDDPVLKQIRDELMGLDLDNLTPMEALNKLYNIRKLLK